LFYHMVGKHRQWYSAGNEPYRVEYVWRQMPKDFSSTDYTKFPEQYEELYQTLLNKVTIHE